MNHHARALPCRRSTYAIVACALGLLAGIGCSTPNRANIDLRKENQALRNQVAELERQQKGHLAQIKLLEKRATTVPVLPQERVQRLFTVHGLQFGRLTGGADLHPDTPGDDGLKVYVVPTDGSGQPIKSAGSFVVEAFDLARREGDRLVGRWEFPVEQAAKNWFGQAMLYTYVLTCPWPADPPQNSDLTLRVTFTDELTGRSFTEQRVVRVKLSD